MKEKDTEHGGVKGRQPNGEAEYRSEVTQKKEDSRIPGHNAKLGTEKRRELKNSSSAAFVGG